MKKCALTLIGALLLAATGLPATAAGQTSKQAKSKRAENVNVVNSPNVNVVNTPAVNVTNTPTVNVGNTPSVNVTNVPNVNLKNTAAQPVFSSTIDDPGRIAYQSQVSNSSGSCSGAGTCFFNFASVPAGHRIVVEHISGLISFATTPNSVWVQLNNGSGAPVSTFFAPLAPSTSFSAFDQTVQAYFDPAEHGGIIEVQVALIGGTFTGAVSPNQIVLSGHILDCTAAPCMPIAH
jgi:hypothetical protein